MSRRQRGYTLIEVLVAFSVLAVALAVLLAALTNSARQVSWSERAGRAALHARSVIDEHTTATTLASGRSEGEFEDGRYRWTLDISDFQDPQANGRQLVDPAAERLLQLQLTMRWGDGPREQLQLTSLRLSRPTVAMSGVGP